MTQHDAHRLTILTAVMLTILAAALSCSGRRNAQVRQTLTVADSLIMTQPQAALDTLITIDSSDAADLPRADKAFYTLLRTESKYKCWLPVVSDTDIAEAADYYRRKGPEDRLARALVMQGAVLSERGDAESAMLAYKEAEPLLERSGDLEQLGLLHTRIAELYQYTMVNIPESISRLKSALSCFQKAHDDTRATTAMLSLANLYMMADSSETAYNFLIKGLETAELSGDTLSILDGRLSLAGYYFHGDRADYLKCRRTALSAVRIIDVSDNDYIRTTFSNRLFNLIAKSYAMTGHTDSAAYYLNKISGGDRRTAILRLSIKGLIASQKRDSVNALKYKMAADSLYYSEKISGYQEDLQLLEKSSENALLRIQLENTKRRHTIDVLVIIIVILSAAILGLAAYGTVKKTRSRLEQSLELIRLLEENSRKKESKLSEELKRHLDKYASLKAGWTDMHDSLLNMENLILDTYYRYGSTSTLAARIKDIIDSHFPEKQTYEKINTFLNLSYPGFMDSFSAEHTSLTDKNLYLVALIACGFSTGAICALLRCSENTLYVTKTRIAKKLGLTTGLTSYIAGYIETYHHRQGQAHLPQ